MINQKTINTQTIKKILQILQKEYLKWQKPAVTEIAERTKEPFQVLISTMLSLRTKDKVTAAASKSLLTKGSLPESLITLSASEIEQLIYPVAFYKRKAENILKVGKILIKKFNSKVPDDLDLLLSFPGVGRKTANLVLTLGFNKPGICVDTHVHRISNRLGYVNTVHPDETEMVLRKKLPHEWWIPINDILVSFGQNLCKPLSPWCSKCPVRKYCLQINIKNSR